MTDSNEGFIFTLIDIEAIRFYGAVSARRANKNMLRLALNIATAGGRMDIDTEPLVLALVDSYFKAARITRPAGFAEEVHRVYLLGRER